MARILLIVNDREAEQGHAREILETAGFDVRVVEPSGVLGVLYGESPDLVILESGPETGPALAREIKNDLYFNLIPILALLPGEFPLEWDDYPVDDCLNPGDVESQLVSRVNLALNRIRRVLDNNPLTRLPGNTSIRRVIEASVGMERAVCYIDINHFKPWNDRFGFKSGDEIIQVVARVAANTVQAHDRRGFVGHIGGDDFVFVTALGVAETVAREIITHFQGILKGFLPAEALGGFYKGRDRGGLEKDLPVPALSIALVPANHPDMNHYLRITEAATLLNKRAKAKEGGGYLMYEG